MAIVINPAFSGCIPPLAADEYERLEASICAVGCLDPLVVWPCRDADQQRDMGEIHILMDGHNRFEICMRHDIDFDTVELEFEDEDEAKLWIIDHQLGRRNLSDFVKAELALQAKPLIKARAEAQRGQRTDLLQNSGKGPEPIHTHLEVAKRAGVSHDTISKVERIKEGGAPALIDAVRSGEVSINLAAKAVAQDLASSLGDAPITRAGLRDAVRQSLGIVASAPAQPRSTPTKPDTLWVEWTSAVQCVAQRSVDFASVAAMVIECELDDTVLAEALAALSRLPDWIKALETAMEASHEINGA